MVSVDVKHHVYLLTLHCQHQNDSGIKLGSDESHFNASFIDCEGQSHKTISTNHNLFEEKGEQKQNRAERPFCLPA